MTESKSLGANEQLPVMLEEYRILSHEIDSNVNRCAGAIGGYIGVLIGWAYFAPGSNLTPLLLAIAGLIFIPAAALYVYYCYIVYRTSKAARAVQADRINGIFGPGKHPLIWEPYVWKEIWGRGRVPHSRLTIGLIIASTTIFVAPAAYNIYALRTLCAAYLLPNYVHYVPYLVAAAAAFEISACAFIAYYFAFYLNKVRGAIGSADKVAYAGLTSAIEEIGR